MNYVQALAYLQSFTDYEQLTSSGGNNRFNLDRVVRLLELLEHPEARYRAVHIVGTKGKGSTAAMIDASLRAAGYATGFFVSPHLHTFCERIRVNGRYIDEDELATLAEQIQPLVAAEHSRYPDLGALTTFEVTTAIALWHFARRKVDFAVLEAGMGGRLDATNVVTPLVTVLAPIGLDHTKYLGNTLAEIAAEKAAVIKPGGLVVSAEQRPEAQRIIEDVARAAAARLRVVGRDWLWHEAPDGSIVVSGPEREYSGLVVGLLGRHQKENAALAIAALDALGERGVNIPDAAMRDAIASVKWPGRLETLSERPMILADGAHNPDSMRRLREALQSLFGDRTVLLILGCSADKDLSGIAREIVPFVRGVIATRSHHARSAEVEAVAKVMWKQGISCREMPDVASALELARRMAGPRDLICVTGSLFVVAEARDAVLGAAL